jgi:hypothetical protein
MSALKLASLVGGPWKRVRHGTRADWEPREKTR